MVEEHKTGLWQYTFYIDSEKRGINMIEILNALTTFMNRVHDIILSIVSMLGFTANDKMIHFFFIGFMGLILYLIVDLLFKKLAKYGISLLSFIYAFSVIVVVSVVIEIQQKLTGEGNMEFADIVYGLWGFALFFITYLIIVLGIKFVYKKLKRKRA